MVQDLVISCELCLTIARKKPNLLTKSPNADMGMGQNPGVLVLTSRILPENGRGDMDNKAMP